MSTLTADQWKAYYDALAAAKASPVAALLDELAIHDLVRTEQWMQLSVPRDSKNEDAQRVMEYCAKVRAATVSMDANRWLRKAMVSLKDFMLWDDSVFAEPFKNQSGKKAPKPKTKLYEKFAALYPGNKNAAQKLRDACETDAECMAVFFWRERDLIERENGERITVYDMTSQLQKARQRMKKRSEKKT